MKKRSLVGVSRNEGVLFRSPAAVLRAESVAIVGASERARWPGKIFQNLRDFGYPGRVYPINPRYAEVWGVKCYPSLSALPEPAQHVIVIIPAEGVQAVIEEAAAAGVKAATVYAGNIGEGTDPEIVARGTALRTFAEAQGMTLAGPNCMGAMSMREKYFLYPNSELCRLPPGSVGAIFQSGGTLQFMCKTAADRGVKFSYMISSGNELMLDLADYVNFLVDDEHTKVIVAFIEGIRRPKEFMVAAARALEAGKPIIAIKTGRSANARETAKSHTGAIAGDYETYLALCERYGIVNCTSLDEMVEMMLAFQAGRLPKGPRVGYVTTSGGTVNLLHDYLEHMPGLQAIDFEPQTKAAIRPLILATQAIANPLDAGIPSSDDKAAAMCKAVLADPNVDMLAWAGMLPTGKGAREATALRSVVEATDKPVIGFGRMQYMVDARGVAFQDEVGFPFLMGLQPTLNVLSAMAFYGARAGNSVPALPAAKSDGGDLAGAALDTALAAHHLTPPASEMAGSPQDAAKAAARIGFPVALKIVSQQISHKTEVGGVTLNLHSADAVVQAAESLAAGARKARPDAQIDGFLVQEMVSGVEMLLGARNDPLYGPVIALGAGGVLVELLKDVTLRMLPITPADARAMIGELKAAKLLDGFRGAPAADIDALVAAICGLGDFFLSRRDALVDIEINPLIVRTKGKGVRAVDVRIDRREAEGAPVARRA